MQITTIRYLLIASVLLAGAGLYALTGETHGVGAPRWPSADAVFAAERWTVEPLVVDRTGTNTDMVTRVYRNAAGTAATLSIVTNQAPKLYGAGAEVPFRGNGFAVEPAPPDLLPLDHPEVSGLVARRGSERWVVMYAYGEQRGLLGNGPIPWMLAVFDGLTGQANSYYKLYLMSRTDRVEVGQQVGELAGTLFPRIAAWYGA